MSSKKIGRNEPCPCGSLKKYKHCCFHKLGNVKNIPVIDTAEQIKLIFNSAFQNHQGGQLSQAEALYQQVLAQQANHVDALHLLGLIYHQSNRTTLGLALIEKAISISPDYAMYNNLANILREQKNYSAAIKAYQQSIALNPNYAEAYNNLGVAYLDTHEYSLALEYLYKSIALKPDYAEAYSNIGNVYQAEYKLELAISFYQQAIGLNDNNPDFYNNLGTILKKLTRYDKALLSYKKSLDLQPNSAKTHHNIAEVLANQKRVAEAIVHYQLALMYQPDNRDALGSLFYIRQYCCDWTDYAIHKDQVISTIESGTEGYKPLSFLAVSDSALLQQRCAEDFVGAYYQQIPKYTHSCGDNSPRKIKLAYVSADFRDHAVSVLMVELFERHDRERFEVIAISLRPGTESSLSIRVKQAFDQFIDVNDKSDAEVAELIYTLHIGIAIDLMGHTANSRSSLFAYRPAPIQINYLGYPGTTGLNALDYIIADEFVIPHEHQSFYTEKVVYLPDCFQVNDSKRFMPKGDLKRVNYGLSESSFVFCSFNNSYKVTPEMFTIWLRLLKAVPHSVLWLFADNALVEKNQKQFAVIAGIDPERLIFANKVTYQEYLARYQLADLCLDTLPFNAGTTASDALWVGLPIITCAGEAFAARMAGSLLNAIGLPELVTKDLNSYEALALKLATQPDLLAAIRAKLTQNRPFYSLFDTQRFCFHIEKAYEAIWWRFQQGLEPESFSVELGEQYCA